jgi:hypothetical protein
VSLTEMATFGRRLGCALIKWCVSGWTGHLNNDGSLPVVGVVPVGSGPTVSVLRSMERAKCGLQKLRERYSYALAH